MITKTLYSNFLKSKTNKRQVQRLAKFSAEVDEYNQLLLVERASTNKTLYENYIALRKNIALGNLLILHTFALAGKFAAHLAQKWNCRLKL